MLELEKAHSQVHRNIPSVNAKPKVVKHLIRIQPLSCYKDSRRGLAYTCLESPGELVRWHPSLLDQKAIKS